MKRIAICVLFFWPGFNFHATGQPDIISTSPGNYLALPLSFEANAGQADESARFLSRGIGYALYLTDEEAMLALRKGGCPDLRPGEATCAHETAVVRMRLQGRGAQAATPEGVEQLRGVANYFIGNKPAEWHTSVPTYARVRYRGVYPGVDLTYYGNQRRLEYDFVVAQGADPKQIRLRFAGAKGLRLGTDGDMVVTTASGDISFHKPVVYQMVNGQRKPVVGGFALVARNTAGFRLGSYDRRQPLVIDPVLEYSTYIGGTSADAANAIAADAEGNVYVAGSAESVDFPVTPGTLQKTNNAPTSVPTAFVAKLNPTGTALLYSTYLGGSRGDMAYGLAVDGAGNAYIAGQTASSDFPTTTGAFQTANPGLRSGFVSRLNPTGTALLYSTYLGGGSGGFGLGEIAMAVAVDSTGNAYVAGATHSVNFPVTMGAFQTENKGFFCSNAFVTKLNPAGSALVYSTYLGGNGAAQFSIGPEVFDGDVATGLWVDSAGNAYVNGYAHSGNFPVTAGAFQSKNNAYQTTGVVSENPGINTFVTKLNPTGTALVYSTYIGGSGHDSASGLAVDGLGNAYITGGASSADFPVTSGALQTTNHSATGYNAFVTKLNPAGSALVYSTYLGGSGSDHATALAVDGTGDTYITGAATSADFPVTPRAFQTTNQSAGGVSVFVTELDATGSALVYSTYLGGSGGDMASGLAMNGSGNVFIAGVSSSADFPVTPGVVQTTNRATNKGSNAFVAKLDLSADLPAPSITPGGVNPIYSIASTIQPGQLVSIKGVNLAGSTVIANANYRTSFGGTSVTINGKAAYLLYVSPTQINLQAPDDTATGSVPIVVTTASGVSASTVNLAPFAPSFLLLDSKHATGIILRSNGSGAYGGGTYDIIGPTGNSLGYPTVAAKAGDTIELFAVGLGPTNPSVPAGQTFSGAAPVTNTVNLLINNAIVTPLFAGLSSQGLYQINVTIPVGLGVGDVSLQASVGGFHTQSGVVISLQ